MVKNKAKTLEVLLSKVNEIACEFVTSGNRMRDVRSH